MDKKLVSPIMIELTGKQMNALAPIFEIVKKECAAGRRGMALAQVYGSGYMRVGFVDSEVTKKIENKGALIDESGKRVRPSRN